MNLNDTIPLMISGNTEDNIKAEYYQTCIRIDTTKRMLDDIDKGNVSYIPKSCLENKYDNLLKYKQILKDNIEKAGIHFNNRIYILMYPQLPCASRFMKNLVYYSVGFHPEIAMIEEVENSKLLTFPFSISPNEDFPITIFVRDGIELERINCTLGCDPFTTDFTEIEVAQEIIKSKFNKWFVEFDN